MIASLAKRHAEARDEVARSKEPTKPVRIHQDVAELVEMLAPIYKQSVPDFISDQLRTVLRKLADGAPRQLDERLKKGLKEL